ncbi:MAG: helix-turn-helix domain-containing protein [Bdellovibrionales bacterium]
MTLSPEQLRAARGLLNISQDELARQTGIAVTSIRQFELGVTTNLQQKTNRSLLSFFSDKVEFIGKRGVALRERSNLLLEGPKTKELLLEDIAAHRQEGELLVLCGEPSSESFEIASFCAALKECGVPSRTICHKKDLPFPLKTIPVQFNTMGLQLVYGSTVAQMIAPQQMLLTRSSLLAEGIGQVFELLWKMLPEENGQKLDELASPA